MVEWTRWQQDKQFIWGSDHRGEDTQVAFFLRNHGLCLDVPVNDAYAFRLRGGVWGGFETSNPLGPFSFIDQCYSKIQKLIDNECFAYAHKVPMEWMPILLGVMQIHVANLTKCPLFGKGISRLVNGTVYRKVEADNRVSCAVYDCDACLKDEFTSSCCGWEEE
jgi:hypothetical protein